MASNGNGNNTKRRGRKPRGGIASLDDILAYPTTTTSGNFVEPVQITTLPSQPKSLAPFTQHSSSNAGSEEEVHMHHIDYPWHEVGHGESIITPQEFQIRNISHSTGSSKSIKKSPSEPANLSSSSGAAAHAAAVAEQELMDDELDDMDVFPNEEFIDYETVFRTQTTSSQSKTLHMSARDREAVEVFRPQNNSSSDDGVLTNVPEHMRIISLPANVAAPSSSITSSSNHNQPQPVPEFYHPFRIHFQPPIQHHALEDAISWPSKSPFACWCCKHTFESYPKVTPVSIRGDQIEVIGNFCSWNCSKTWTLQELKRLDLFNTFYHILFGTSSNEVTPAPSFLSIDTFGGPFTIEQYRSGLNNPERQVRFETFSNVHIVVSKMFVRAH